MSLHLQCGQCDSRHADIGGAAAAVNDGPGCQHARSRGLQAIHDVACAAAGGDHVLHHDGGLAGPNRKAAAQHHLAAFRIAFGEQKRSAQRARGLVADDQAAQSGRHHQRGLLFDEGVELGGQAAPEFLGHLGMAQHQRALQVVRTVQSAGQAKMAFEVSAGGAEQIENGIGLRRHKGLLYH